jgi:hypothetical protein
VHGLVRGDAARVPDLIAAAGETALALRHAHLVGRLRYAAAARLEPPGEPRHACVDAEGVLLVLGAQAGDGDAGVAARGRGGARVGGRPHAEGDTGGEGEGGETAHRVPPVIRAAGKRIQLLRGDLGRREHQGLALARPFPQALEAIERGALLGGVAEPAVSDGQLVQPDVVLRVERHRVQQVAAGAAARPPGDPAR